MRSKYDIVTFNVYGALPEEMFFSPKTLQSIVDNDPIVQTLDLCFIGNGVWCKMIDSEDGTVYYHDENQAYDLKPCCRKATYLCRNRRGKLYLLVARD